jgi:copper chaperone CopZ
MSQRTYAVTGMTCTHCIRSVTAEVGSLPGVESVVVHLGRGHVDVIADEQPDLESVRAAIDEAGYELVGAVS